MRQICHQQAVEPIQISACHRIVAICAFLAVCDSDTLSKDLWSFLYICILVFLKVKEKIDKPVTETPVECTPEQKLEGNNYLILTFKSNSWLSRDVINFTGGLKINTQSLKGNNF